VDENLRAALEKFGIERLEALPDLVYAVSSDLRLSFVNARYREAAAENGLEGYPLGAEVLDAMDEPLREHYAALFEETLGGREPIATEYVCPTPTEQVHLRCVVYPLENDGLLLVHSEIQRRPWTDEELDRLRDVDTALLPQCSGCRRVRTPSGEWLYVPRLLEETPARTTHGLCDPCLGYYISR